MRSGDCWDGVRTRVGAASYSEELIGQLELARRLGVTVRTVRR